MSFATLELTTMSAPDALISFDPVLNCLPGLDNYEWVRQFREPSYGAARRDSHRVTQQSFETEDGVSGRGH